MKKETKELVEFIKDCVFRYQTELKRGEVDVGMIDGEKEDKTCDKAITFLDSLPEIESHLCRGGYIQDKNGTPCCDGDQLKCVLIEYPQEDWFYGKLTWNANDGVFEIYTNTNTYTVTHMSWFEKVKD